MNERRTICQHPSLLGLLFPEPWLRGTCWAGTVSLLPFSLKSLLRPCSRHHSAWLCPKKRHPQKFPPGEFFLLHNVSLYVILPSASEHSRCDWPPFCKGAKWNSKRCFYVKKLVSHCLGPPLNSLLVLKCSEKNRVFSLPKLKWRRSSLFHLFIC